MTISRSAGSGFVSATTLGSLTDNYTYNSYGELATYTATFAGAPLYSVTYTSTAAPRDQLGRVVQNTETLEGATRVQGYSYDEQGRLTDVTENGSLLEHYEYDLNGNRTHAVVGGDVSEGVYDDQDRPLSYGPYTYTYGGQEVQRGLRSVGAVSAVLLRTPSPDRPCDRQSWRSPCPGTHSVNRSADRPTRATTLPVGPAPPRLVLGFDRQSRRAAQDRIPGSDFRCASETNVRRVHELERQVEHILQRPDASDRARSVRELQKQIEK